MISPTWIEAQTNEALRRWKLSRGASLTFGGFQSPDRSQWVGLFSLVVSGTVWARNRLVWEEFDPLWRPTEMVGDVAAVALSLAREWSAYNHSNLWC